MQNGILIPLEPLATRLCLPRAWLRAEVDAGRIPFLQVGRRRVFDEVAVRKVLAVRAAQLPAPADTSQDESDNAEGVQP